MQNAEKLRQARCPRAASRCSRATTRLVPDSAGFDLVSGFALFVEVAAVDVVYDRDGEVLHLRIS
jgi:hypothetical protein